MRRPSLLLLLLGALLVGACGVERGDRAATEGPPEPTLPAEPLSAGEVLELTRGSVALIQTPLGTGSSVLLDDGHLVTNAHVVDPFRSVSVTFEGDGPIVDVPVVGVDLVADLAVVGPVEVDRTPLVLDDAGELDSGDDLFLVGYPGDQREQEATVSRGVLSRRRQAPEWDLEFLQSDNTIGGGQSGGALVDDRGRVVGISGMRDGDGFALSLAATDVTERVAAILDGSGSEGWRPVPDLLDTDHELDVDEFALPRQYYLGVGDEDRTIEVAVEGAEPEVAVSQPGSIAFPFAANQRSFDIDDSWWDLEDAEVLREAGEATWAFDLDAGEDVVISVSSLVEGDLALRVSEPVGKVAVQPQQRILRLGEPVRATVGYLDDWIEFPVELVRGREVEIAVRSATGDLAWDLQPDLSFPTWDGIDTEAMGASADDGGGGLFDLDAVDTYEVPESGRYLLTVYSYDGMAAEFEVSVTEV
jgi:hypothetical protein